MSSQSNPVSFLSIWERDGECCELPLGPRGLTVNGSTCHRNGHKLPISIGPTGGRHVEYDGFSSVNLHEWPQPGHGGKYQMVQIPIDGQTTITPLTGGGTEVVTSRVVNAPDGFEIHCHSGDGPANDTVYEVETEEADSDPRATHSTRNSTGLSSLGNRK